MNNKTSRLALSGMFVAVMMVLGYIESMIPFGVIPGIKIGLANSVLLLSLYWLGISISIFLMLVKVFLTAIMFGNFYTFWYSLAGGILSLLIMIVLIYLIEGVSPIGAGVAGAVAHNVGQIIVAMITFQTNKLLYYMAVLVLVAIMTGTMTGTVAKMLMHYLPKKRKEMFIIKNN